MEQKLQGEENFIENIIRTFREMREDIAATGVGVGGARCYLKQNRTKNQKELL